MDANGKDAISLLPEEVWKYILDFAVANNEKTLLNCNLTCHLFKQLLRQHNFRLKLHLVLPHLYPYLSGSDILKCRSICKTWCSVVNKSNPEGEPKISIRLNQVGTRNNLRINHVFRNAFPILFRHLQSVRNPVQVRARCRRQKKQFDTKDFIFRSIILTIGPNVNVYRDVIPYLNKMKPFVRALHIQFPVRQIDRFFFQLTEILSKFSDLEYLKLSTLPVEQTDLITEGDLLGFSLPRLYKLKELNVQGLPSVLQVFFMCRYNSQMIANCQRIYDTCLVMSRQDDQFMWKGPTKLMETRIGNRPLTHAHFSISLENYSTFKFTEKIQSIGLNLQTLSITWISGTQWNASISWNTHSVDPEAIQPNLASCFEFLKDLRNLEQLKIKLRCEAYTGFLQSKESLNGTLNIIDLVKNLEDIADLEDDDIVFRKLYQSNIWSLLQKLKSICIVLVNGDGDGLMKRVYTRREFNELYL